MANREIKTKVAIDGEKEYKESLKNINSALGTLKSELKLVESQYAGQANSYAALSAKGDVLSCMYDKQKEKVKAAAEQLEKAKKAQSDYAEKVSSAKSEISRCEAALAALGDETGDTTEEQAKLTAELEKTKSELAAAKKGYESTTRSVNSYQTQVNSAETELNKLGSELDKNASYMDEAAKSSDGCAKSINELGKEVDTEKKAQKEAADAAKEHAEKMEKLGAAAKVAAAAVVAVTAAAVKLGKEVIDAYADYEQLVGGVETLFKDSSAQVMQYANDAYKTAGLSANEYMETVTGFSASLISSLGGDTEKAAKYADMAITDMSDNANKMGSDMASIQNAYSGFAKQNYTMLDNLKLGYGGTKEEMQRLLEDAEKLSGVKYDISSYSDIVDAIHVVQTEMGITGTTAKEAEATISGSIGMLKSSFQNLITGLGDADADVDKLCDNVVNSFNSVIKNISPVIENLAKTVPNAFEGILDAISPLLPEFLEMGAGMFEALLNGLVSMLPGLVSAVASIVPMLVESIIEALPLVVDAAVQFIAALVQGIAEALPTLIPAAVEAVATIATTLIDNVPLLIEAAGQLIESLVTTLLDAIPQIIETGVELLTALVENLPEIITTICEVLPQIIESTISTLLDHLPEIVEAGVKLLTALITNLPQIILTIVQALPQIITAVINALVNNIPKIIETGVKLLTALITNLPQIIAEIVRAMPQIITGIVSALGEGVSQVAEVGANLVRGLWQGIQSLAGWLWDKVSGWISSIWDGITDFFGIHSPSTKMAWVSEMNVEGAVVGIEKNKSKAVKAYGAMGEEMLAEVDSGLAAVNDKLKSSIGEIETGFSAKATVEAVSASVPADLTGRGGGATTSGGGDTNVVNHFHIAELVVREEADVKKISRELYNMQKSKSRSKGVSMA
jgi:phage-related protein/predicted  nucleic acid-binding Zn-ribbon protein